MTVIAWPECKHGHSLRDPANVYVTQQGHRRCRACKRESDLRCRAERTPLIAAERYPNRKPVSARKYRNWARTVWEEMSEDDRMIVRFALGYGSLQEVVS